MRRVALAGAALALLAVPVAVASPASAAESITRFQVDATVNADTTVSVTETITWNFGSANKHGIFRFIPEYSELPDGYRQYYGIDVTSVTQDGKTVPVAQSTEGAYLNLKIGSASTTVTGTHTYVIEYTVTGALTTIPEDATNLPGGVVAGAAELYWNFVGTQWDYPIGEASFSLTGPSRPLGAQIYIGRQGSTFLCEPKMVGDSLTCGPIELNANEGLTGVVAYDQESFTAPITPDIRKGPGAQALAIAMWTIPSAVVLGLIPIVWAIARRRRNRGVVIQYAPVQYGPPDNLRPAEVAAAWEGDVGAKALTATILDLTARKHVTIAQANASELIVTWRGEGDDLLPWENSLLAAILKGQPQASLGHYDETVTATVTAVDQQLVGDALATGRRNPDGDKPDRPWKLLAGIGLVASVIVLVLSIWGGLPVVAAALLPFTAMALIAGAIAAWITPRMQTRASAMFLSKTEGFRRLLDTDAAGARREFAHRLGLNDQTVFATMLPYAVIFGLSHAWLAAFPDLTEEQLHGMGYNIASTYLFMSMIDMSTSSMVSTMTAPSRSGGSGFSGGFSGGGGGGGGGGSW